MIRKEERDTKRELVSLVGTRKKVIDKREYYFSSRLKIDRVKISIPRSSHDLPMIIDSITRTLPNHGRAHPLLAAI